MIVENGFLQKVLSVQIFILSKDRPNYLEAALRSALHQIDNNVEIIVSDNSEKNDVEIMLATKFPGVKILRRIPSLNVFEHYRTLINEATADLIVFFHDDDILLPGYANIMRNHMTLHPELSAAACNAKIINGNTITDNLVISCRQDKLQKKSSDLLSYYFALSTKGPAPFPSYMYRRSCIQGLFMDPCQGGKYADVSFLLKVLECGPILWLCSPHMCYRRHGNNDSALSVVGHHLGLLRYVYGKTGLRMDSPLAYQYRYLFWVNWWLNVGRKSRVYPWRGKIVLKFIITRTFIYAHTNKEFRRRVFRKLIKITHEWRV